MCGALAAGVLAIGFYYGRTSPKQPRFGCASELSGWLHRRFQEELGGKCCAMIRPFYQKMDQEKSCAAVYQKGAELAVQTILSAPVISSQCQMPRSLQNLGKRASPSPSPLPRQRGRG